ncbi:uncharacterized protein TNIN_184891 [Trichonephila inaurata madagascariensis]|uniref:Uncharacterized protein n=1 Tax=Trichonephila inaurata madagascariensis TaxID=2747483 RepID=A0A8X6M4W6_9ARAC|nr:uncharacterized protein TNIN_184891 [Trichonephila inaurata madagascariensis]
MVVTTSPKSETFISPKEEPTEDATKEHVLQPIWVMKRNNMIRKPQSKIAASCASRKRNMHHKNSFHMDLRNKWSQLVTNKISALAFQHSLRDHQCNN